jgi:hypothetical protein
MIKSRYVGNYKLKYNFDSNSQLCPTEAAFKKVGNYKLKYNFDSNSQHQERASLMAIGWEL